MYHGWLSPERQRLILSVNVHTPRAQPPRVGAGAGTSGTINSTFFTPRELPINFHKPVRICLLTHTLVELVVVLPQLHQLVLAVVFLNLSVYLPPLSARNTLLPMLELQIPQPVPITFPLFQLLIRGVMLQLSHANWK